MTFGRLGLSGLTLGGTSAAGSAPTAPVVVQRVSVIGDSWVEENEQILSRTGGSTVSDGWTYQLNASLGFTRYTTPGQSTAGGTLTNSVTRVGYGGQTAQTVNTNWQAIIVADTFRKDDVQFWSPGRNEVTSPGGETFPAQIITATAAFLAARTHDRIIIAASYGNTQAENAASGSVTSQPNWVRVQAVKKDYWRTKRKFYYNQYADWAGFSPFGSDGTATNDTKVAGNAVPGNCMASASADQNHPNYVAAPLQAAGVEQIIRAHLRQRVWVKAHTIPDVQYDMAAGTKLEVYFAGYVTSCSISTDDPTNPGLFTIAMKAGSNDTAELTRTSVSAGNIPAILYLGITANGYDTLGASKTHTNTIRLLPSAIGAASTLPIGATLPRDPNATSTSRRWPFMAASATPFSANRTAFTLVFSGKVSEDGTAMTLCSLQTTRILFQRTTGNKWSITIKDTAGTTMWTGTTVTSNFNIAGGTFTLFFSIDIPTTTVHCWGNIGGADVNISPGGAVTAGTGFIDLTTQFNWFANTYTAQVTWKGGVRSLWMTDAFFDFSNSTNRRLFCTLAGAAVDLGSDGSTGTGVTPKYYFRGHHGDFVMGKNFGSANDVAFNDNWGTGQGSLSDPSTF